MKYGLDISNAKLPEWWPNGGPSIIPIRKGRMKFEWDVCKSKVPAKFYDELLTYLESRFPNGVEPPGFNAESIPHGAKIVTMECP